MQRCLLDTTALSDLIQPATRRSPVVARHLKTYLRSHGRLTFSLISCYEVLRGLRKKQAGVQERQFQHFCGHAEILPIDYHIIEVAATLWSQGQAIGVVVDDGDLIIAATALVHKLPLVTANTRHFSWIAELTLTNWREA